MFNYDFNLKIKSINILDMFISIRYCNNIGYMEKINKIVKQLYRVELKNIVFLDGNMNNLKINNIKIIY